MQYSKWGTVANRHGDTTQTLLIMPHNRTGTVLRLLAVLMPLGLSACADTLTTEETKSSSTLQRDYEDTLTKAEKDQAISDLQAAKAKQQGGETASTEAQPAKTQQ
jgi:hypothetical protein